MQWKDGKNHGFSESDTPYLPTDNREGAPTVEAQQKDENSVLNFVKKLIKIHKDIPALWADADFNILLPSYPFVYEREAEGKKLFIAINPSDYRHYYDAPPFKNILVSQNISHKNGQLVMDSVSFVVAEI